MATLRELRKKAERYGMQIRVKKNPYRKGNIYSLRIYGSWSEGISYDCYTLEQLEKELRHAQKLKHKIQRKKPETYYINCQNCETQFEVSEADVGKPPFTVSCPNCGADVKEG